MIDSNKAVFLPVDDKIINLFKGFILNGEPLLNIKESDVYTETKYYEFDSTMSKTEKVFRVIFIILFVPIFIIVLIIAALFKKIDFIIDKMEYWLDIFFSIFFNKKKELKITRTKNKKYDATINEDVPDFLNHCKKHFAKVIVYSYQKLTAEQNTKIELLIQTGFVSSFQIISKLSDLIPFLKSESISILNSLLIISNSSEKDEAALLGFHLAMEISEMLNFGKKESQGVKVVKQNLSGTVMKL